MRPFRRTYWVKCRIGDETHGVPAFESTELGSVERYRNVKKPRRGRSAVYQDLHAAVAWANQDDDAVALLALVECVRYALELVWLRKLSHAWPLVWWYVQRCFLAKNPSKPDEACVADILEAKNPNA